MRDRLLFRGVAVTVAVFILLLAVLLTGIRQIDTRNSAERAASLKAAVLRATVTCYAVEGRYPTDVAYLEANYGLAYDRQKFIVTIDSFADNLLPDLAVLAKE